MFPDLRREIGRGDGGARFRGLCDRRPERRRTGRRDVRHRRPHRAAACRMASRGISWGPGRRSISSRPSRGASTCSTACCRPGTPATASCSRAGGGSTSGTRATRRIARPPDEAVRVLHVPHLFAGLPAAPPPRRRDRRRRALTRCIISTFTLTRMRRIREAIVFDSLEELRQAFHQAYSRRSRDS